MILRPRAAEPFDARAAEVLAQAEGFYADYNADVDRKVFAAVFPLYMAAMPEGFAPAVATEAWTEGADARAIAEDLYEGSILDDGEAFMALLREGNRKALKKESGDAVLRWAKETSDSYWVQVRGEYGKRMGALDDDMGRYLRGLQEVYPDSTFWPDANSTLRLTFGRMEGSEPRDAEGSAKTDDEAGPERFVHTPAHNHSCINQATCHKAQHRGGERIPKKLCGNVEHIREKVGDGRQVTKQRRERKRPRHLIAEESTGRQH